MEERPELISDLKFREQLALNFSAIALQVGCFSGKIKRQMFCRRPAAPDGAVDPLAGQQIDQAGGIADQEEIAVDQRRIGTSDGKRGGANPPERGGIEAVEADRVVESPAEGRSDRRQAADADIEMISLWEEPVISAGDLAEIGPDAMTPLFGKAVFGGDIPLQGDDPPVPHCKPGALGGNPVSAVGRDQRAPFKD